jgi:hypothetical protein
LMTEDFINSLRMQVLLLSKQDLSCKSASEYTYK